MKMIFRWFPDGEDSVTLDQIRQIPGMTGVCACLPKVEVGKVWDEDLIMNLKNEIESHGLSMEVIESVNIHEDIKKGLSTRDEYIANYITTMKNLSKASVKCICYNFMPVMDWVRSELFHTMDDGSSAMYYKHEDAKKLNPTLLADSMIGNSKGFYQPGWEKERVKDMAADIEFYKNISEDEYFANIKYFLDAIIPYAEKYDIKMAIHPDDPPFDLFGLPKVINNKERIRKFLSLNDSKYNGLTLCTGSLGADVNNDICDMIQEFGDRIHFAHIRNIKHINDYEFTESAHLSECGDLDMYKIVKTFIDSGFDGYVRPDHGRMIWDEQARPGYGLYDRALGAVYLQGLWEAIKKNG